MVELKKTLSFKTILLITMNSILGTGVFFLPALAAGISGPASIISWIIISLIALGLSLIFAELVGMYPFAGGVYEYTKQAFGPIISFFIGWLTMIAGNITIAMLVVGAIQYLNPELNSIIKIIISIAFILGFNIMAYRGMKTSAIMLIAFGIITLATIFSLIIPGFLHIKIGNFIPFFVTPFSKILLTVFFIAETFFGLETSTFLAEETKDAKHVMPKAMWLGTLIIAIVVILFVITTLGSINWQIISKSKAPLSDLALLFYGEKSNIVFSLLVYLSIIGSVAGWIVSAPRLTMSLAKDKLFIPQLGDIHKKYHTPHKAIIFQTILTSILVIIGAGNYETLLILLLPLALILYAFVILSFIKLRIKNPKKERPFKVKCGKTLGILLIISLIGLIGLWFSFDYITAIKTIKIIGGFLFLGVPIFLLVTFYYNPDVIKELIDIFATINYFFENINLPKKIRKEIIRFIEPLEEKTILDFGAGVGTISIELAKQRKNNKLIIVDFSKKNIELIKKRLEKLSFKDYILIHDPYQISRVHPSIEFVDAIISIGNLSYFQDLKKILRSFYEILPEKGKICLVEFVDFFWFIPNSNLLKDEKNLIKIFQENGFKVELVKIRGLFWKYLVIYGEKNRFSKKPYI